MTVPVVHPTLTAWFTLLFPIVIRGGRSPPSRQARQMASAKCLAGYVPETYRENVYIYKQLSHYKSNLQLRAVSNKTLMCDTLIALAGMLGSSSSSSSLGWGSRA